VQRLAQVFLAAQIGMNAREMKALACQALFQSRSNLGAEKMHFPILRLPGLPKSNHSHDMPRADRDTGICADVERIFQSLIQSGKACMTNRTLQQVFNNRTIFAVGNHAKNWIQGAEIA
jgi:hypothetical protein